MKNMKLWMIKIVKILKSENGKTKTGKTKGWHDKQKVLAKTGVIIKTSVNVK